MLAEESEFIHLSDCDLQGMVDFLQYLYTDEVCFNGNNALQLLYLAEKYIIPSLTSRCILFLRDHLDSGNIFCVLKHSNLIQNKSLWRRCWKFIDREAKDVLASTEFLQVDRTDLIELVRRETLNIKEIDLFIAVNKWAENQSKELRLAASSTVKTRQILGEEIIKKLRFPVMEQKDFCNVVCKTDVLIEEEIREVESHFQDQSSPVSFLQKGRRYDPTTERPRRLYYRRQTWDVLD